MQLETLVRISLWVTAPFNLLAGAAFAWPDSALGQLLQLPTATHPFYTLFSGALVALFGVAYIWCAVQRPLPAAVLGIGAAGKLLAVLIAAGLFAAGNLSGVTAMIIAGDLLFVLLWSRYLLTRWVP